MKIPHKFNTFFLWFFYEPESLARLRVDDNNNTSINEPLIIG